jgi:cell division protein ZapA (FtsZ GTPase activity inhibitor)
MDSMLKENIVETTVELAGRSYPILAEASELDVVKNINEQLSTEFSELKSKYPNKLNNQDILAILLFTYAKKLSEKQLASFGPELNSKIDGIEQLIDEALNN